MDKVNSNLIELPNILSSMNTGERIRRERMDKKWSQEELARRSGVSQGLISQFENGVNKGSSYLIAIARALDVEAEWLESEKGSKKKREVNAPMSMHYPPVIEDALAVLPSPEDSEILFIVMRDENGSQVTLRLTDNAARRLAEKLAEQGK